MQKLKNARLRAECQAYLEDDNLEECLKRLSEHFKENQEVIAQRGRLNALRKEANQGVISSEESRRERNQVRVALITFVNEHILAEEADEVLEGIHHRILIARCLDSATNWERLFPNERYTHRHIQKYADPVPDEYKNPDVIIFDDLNCPGLRGNRNEMKRLALEMPFAHLLYFGEDNPFTKAKLQEEQEIYARMGNANTHITLHARLKELLDFRQIFGPPLQTYIIENMKDKLPLRAFISYSHRDEDYKNELDLHLATMKRQGVLKVWQDRKIQPGDDWDEEIKRQMEDSHLIFFMVSPGFMASDYIMEKEVPHAMSLHAAGKAKVVPIFVKHVEWKGTEFGRLQGLPRDEKFIDTQPNKDQAFATVARELRELIENWAK